MQGKHLYFQGRCTHWGVGLQNGLTQCDWPFLWDSAPKMLETLVLPSGAGDPHCNSPSEPCSTSFLPLSLGHPLRILLKETPH